MMTGRTKHISGFNRFLNSLSASLESSQRTTQVHDYTRHWSPLEYVFEKIEGTTYGYMTGQGKGIAKGDYILLNHQDKSEKFQVQAIDYYSSPSEMWSALLSEAE